LICSTYLVRGTFPENVAYVGAGHYLQGAAAHPGLEGQLQILAAPDIEAGIIGAQAIEELPVDGEETAGHCG